MGSDLLSVLEAIVRKRKAVERTILMQTSIHVGQPDMLRFICEHPGCSQKQIADDQCVTPASVAASIKRMERASLIRRRTDTADTRCNRVYITALGEKELAYCCDELQALDDSLTKGMSKSEIDILNAVLLKLLENLDMVSAKNNEKF